MAIAVALGFLVLSLLVVAAMLRFAYRVVSSLWRYVFSRSPQDPMQ